MTTGTQSTAIRGTNGTEANLELRSPQGLTEQTDLEPKQYAKQEPEEGFARGSKYKPEKFAMVYVRPIEDPRLSDSEFRTLAAVAIFANKSGNCYPSLETVAQVRGLHRSTISRHIDHLVKLGYVEKSPSYHEDGSRGSNHYTIIRAPLGMASRAGALHAENNTALHSAHNTPMQPDSNGMLHPECKVRDQERNQMNRGGEESAAPLPSDDCINSLLEAAESEDKQKMTASPLESTATVTNITMPVSNTEAKALKASNTESKACRKESHSSGPQPLPKNREKKQAGPIHLSDTQQIALEAFEKASGLNLYHHRSAAKLADFLIKMYSAKLGPHTYVEWAERNGAHKEEFGRYARFPEDIMVEYQMAFRSRSLSFGRSAAKEKDERLFEGALRNFVRSDRSEIEPKDLFYK